MNPRFQIQRELLGHLVAVGAIGDAHFIAAMQLVDAQESYAERGELEDRERRRREFDARPWWRKVFTLDHRP